MPRLVFPTPDSIARIGHRYHALSTSMLRRLQPTQPTNSPAFAVSSTPTSSGLPGPEAAADDAGPLPFVQATLLATPCAEPVAAASQAVVPPDAGALIHHRSRRKTFSCLQRAVLPQVERSKLPAGWSFSRCPSGIKTVLLKSPVKAVKQAGRAPACLQL